MSLTKSLGQFIADLSPNRLPEEAARVAQMGFIDCIGTMIAGRNEDSVRILDYDDVALRGHPSTVLVPAILAEAEHLDASGADMITAYVAGYETWAELFRRDTGLLHQKGWHPTGLYGAVGAAAACAKLRKLDAAKSAMAIALGASQSAGLMANFGTMTKPFHAGKAAHAGIMAARLAEAGFTASTDALEHPQGFLHAISPTGTEDRDGDCKAGTEWAILSQGLGIKKYPTCYCTHRAIDGMLDLMAGNPVKADQVAAVTVSMSDYFATVLRNHRPETGLAAKFSIEFCMASGIVAQRVGLRELTDDFVRRPDIQALMRKVEIVTTTQYDPEMPGAAPQDQVTVRLADGRVIAGEPVARATGHPSRPLTQQQLYDKFADCLDVGGASIPADVLFRRLSAIRSAAARDLTAQP
jgi:2-methylcitrate dehydratase PrpD